MCKSAIAARTSIRNQLRRLIQFSIILEWSWDWCGKLGQWGFGGLFDHFVRAFGVLCHWRKIRHSRFLFGMGKCILLDSVSNFPGKPKLHYNIFAVMEFCGLRFVHWRRCDFGYNVDKCEKRGWRFRRQSAKLWRCLDHVGFLSTTRTDLLCGFYFCQTCTQSYSWRWILNILNLYNYHHFE